MKITRYVLILTFFGGLNLCIYAQKQSIGNSYKTSFAKEFSKVWQRHKTQTVDIAKAMPEKYFNFKPTLEVRSFSEGLLHIAASNYAFSSMAGGVKSPFKEGAKSKQEVLKALAESFDFAEGALRAVSEKQLAETMSWRNRLEPATTRTKRQVLHVMREHAAHHRGGLVIYLRLKGIKPPSYVD